MAWPLHVNKLNVVTTFLGFFMVIFMLMSSFVTGRIYMGPAPVALAVGAAFGPKAALFIDPESWASSTAVTLEFSRLVLALQAFGNAIELPKHYVSRHWISVAYVIGPIMVGGWLITTCCAKIMVPSFEWRQALVCAACFNAIDPVLAGTVLSGRWSRRVPKHLRDLLRTETAANGLTTTLILNFTTNFLSSNSTAAFCLKSLFIDLSYASVFGTLAGLFIGYAARRSLRKAYVSDTIDRPSFLAYYLSVAAFSTGFGTIIGVDEVTLAFFAGVGLDNDNWYEQKTEKTFLSSCIDLMLNLCYFTYIGALIPWHSFNSPNLGLLPWRLVVGTLCIFIFRRIPLVLLLKPIIPDLKTWREAAFYGHFGPIGAGSLFSAMLIQGELVPGYSNAYNTRPENSVPHRFLAQLWIVVMFVVVCSSIVHGTSIAIFSLGKQLNTMTIAMSHSQEDDAGPLWMDRLPKTSSQNILAPISSRAIAGSEVISLPGPVSRPRRAEPAVAYQFGNTIIIEDGDG